MKTISIFFLLLCFIVACSARSLLQTAGDEVPLGCLEWEDDKFECFFTCEDDVEYEVECEVESSTEVSCYYKVAGSDEKLAEFTCPVDGASGSIQCDSIAETLGIEEGSCAFDAVASFLQAFTVSE